MSVAPATVDERLASAVQLLRSGRLREAEDVFRYILSREPNDPDALCGLAAVALSRGAAQEAFDLLSRARTMHPAHGGILGALGSAHQALGRQDEALTCIEAAIRLAPDEPAHRLSRARLLMEQQRVLEALTELQAGLALNAEDPDLLNASGTVLMALGRNREGAECFAKVHAADPDRPEAAHNLALALTALGEHDEAVKYAERAYLKDPADASYRVSLAWRLLDIGAVDRALDVARTAVAIAPIDLQAQEALATILVFAGEADQGLAQMANAVRHAHSSVDACLALARVLRRAGRLEHALEALSHARKAAPDDARILDLECELLLALGRPLNEDGAAASPMPDVVFSTFGQAIGDAVFCARWLPPDAVLHCPADEAPLWRGLDHDQVITAAPPGHVTAMTSLMRHVDGRDMDRVANAYLRAPDQESRRWADAVAALPRPHIGIAWGRAPYEIGLAEFAPICVGKGASIALAVGPSRAALCDFPDILDGGAHIQNVADLAAAVSVMDFVVTSSHLVAHLAGALGKPGIVMLEAARPWQWRHIDGRSVWYPTLSVIQQTQAGSWGAELIELTHGIERLVAALNREEAVP